MILRKLATAATAAALLGLLLPSELRAEPGQASPVRLTSVHMITPVAGWAQAGCRVLHTSEGPQRWRDVTPAGLECGRTVADIRPITYFLDEKVGWVARVAQLAGPAGRTLVFRTADGGHTWRRAEFRALPRTQSVFSLFALDPRHVWLMTSSGVGLGQEEYGLFGSADGGRRWTRLTVASVASRGALPSCDCPVGVAFASPKKGWVTGNYFALSRLFFFRTADGGRTWEHRGLALPAGVDPMGVRIDPPVFFGRGVGVLAVQLSVSRFVLYRTRDTGAHWARTRTIAVSSAIGVYYNVASRTDAWVSDGRRLYYTADGGWHWRTIVPNRPVRGPLNFLWPRLGYGIDQSPPYSSHTSLLMTGDGGHTWTVLSPVIVGRG